MLSLIKSIRTVEKFKLIRFKLKSLNFNSVVLLKFVNLIPMYSIITLIILSAEKQSFDNNVISNRLITSDYFRIICVW